MSNTSNNSWRIKTTSSNSDKDKVLNCRDQSVRESCGHLHSQINDDDDDDDMAYNTCS